MAAPVVQAVGAAVASTASVTPVIPTHQADDILLCVAETNSAGVPGTPTENGGWSTSLGFQENATANSRLTLFWIRATSGSMTNPLLGATGNHIMARVAVIRGCVTTGDPWDTTSGGTYTAGTGVSLADLTTSGVDRLILHVVGTGRDLGSTNTQFSNWTNANLTSLTEEWDETSSVAGGGGHAGASGVKATAGAIGNTTVDVTTGTGAGGGYISIAFKPPESGTTTPQTVSATAVATPTVAHTITFGLGLAATVLAVSALSMASTFYRTLSAATTGAVNLLTESTRLVTLAAIALGTAALSRVLTASQALSSTILAIPAVNTAADIGAELFATISAAATIATQYIANEGTTFLQTINATAGAVVNITQQSTRYLTLAATAVISLAISKALTLSQTVSSAVVAVASIAPVQVILVTLSTLGGAIVTIATQFINAPAASLTKLLSARRRRR